MERSSFPQNKDLAHKIMMELSNNDLVKLCAANKRMYELCNNYPDFWRSKFIKDYGEHATQYKPENRSWKNHYMTVFIDLGKYKEDPVKFLNNIVWRNTVNESFFVDEKKKLVPLNQAPEWVMNNLYMLNIPYLKKWYKEGIKEHRNITPIDLLQKQEYLDPKFGTVGGTTYSDRMFYSRQILLRVWDQLAARGLNK